MVNPYGITQVDIPGALNVLEQARSNRIRQMMLQRQLDQDQREADRDERFSTAMARAFPGQRGGAPSTSSTASPAPSGMAAAYSPPSVFSEGDAGPSAPQTVAIAPASAPAVTPPAAGAGGLTPQPQQYGPLDQGIAMELIAADPTRGPQVVSAINQMNAAQRAAGIERLRAIAPLYQTALGIADIAQRRAYIQSVAPQAIQLGASEGELRQILANPTDDVLRAHASFGMSMEQAIASTMPDITEVAGQLVDRRALPRGTPRDPVVFESEFVPGPQGGMYRRSDLSGRGAEAQNLPHANSAEEALRLGPGAQFIGPDNQVHTVPGGQGPGSGNFPRRGGTLTINRNNNPGALRIPGSTGFQRFSSPAEGIRAQEAQLRRYHGRGLRTVSTIVETYAPRQSRGGDNTDAQVSNYIRHVAGRLGISPDTPIPAERIPEVAAAMRQFETGAR